MEKEYVTNLEVQQLWDEIKDLHREIESLNMELFKIKAFFIPFCQAGEVAGQILEEKVK